MQVWKYPIPVMDDIKIAMPRGAELLHVAAQFDQGCLWVRVDPANEKVERSFYLRGTGHEVDADCIHVGSFMMAGGQLVFHLFERRTS